MPRALALALRQSRVADRHGGFHRLGGQHQLGQEDLALVELVAELTDADDEALVHHLLGLMPAAKATLGDVLGLVLVLREKRFSRFVDQLLVAIACSLLISACRVVVRAAARIAVAATQPLAYHQFL